MSPETVMFRERSQTQKARVCDAIDVKCPGQVDSKSRDREWVSGCQGPGSVTADGDRLSVEVNVLELVMMTAYFQYIKNH